MNKGWHQLLEEKLQTIKNGKALSKRYRHVFPSSYLDDYSPDVALDDMPYLEKMSAEHSLEMYLYEDENSLHVRFFQWQTLIPLSEILPRLENFNLRTESEKPHKIQFSDDECVWVSDFMVTYVSPYLVIDKVGDLFKEAFIKVHFGLSENDGFNKLVLGASLSWRDIIILRTYAHFLLQIGFRFSQAYMERTLAQHPLIVMDLVALFKARHDPDIYEETSSKAAALEKQIIDKLELVDDLDEDRILRRFLELIKASLRTNFFQKKADGSLKETLAIKFASELLPELPLPKPLYEIFVYSSTFEGIHLRKDKIARGGIRWSLRREDYRTEILGLMKAQVVKNTVIIPTGAKGGFVLKNLPINAPRELVSEKVVAAYQSFIHALLEMTDNRVDEQFIRPAQVICYDDIDPYLVVAADKGTATFSDIANAISEQHHFWLGDAFASGGSAGYDHKAMGITARGAWESIKRHFFELGRDVYQSDISVVGIGDMSGDVFGNGLLYSRHIKLIAAFDHRHIFIDPRPDCLSSFEERERLFKLPLSSWEDYNPSLISQGGGVFKRSLKVIHLSPQMQEVLETDNEKLTPNELIRVILKAPVDLFYNGGIGTYVKSREESQADAGDRTNDYCRVNADELRCKVVGEGGNLGFTQKARIEYALNGGLINTDFIDNSAGVDCSDHEVNLKILLENEISKGHLNTEKRNDLLVSLTHDIATLVLSDNQEQALVLSFSAASAKQNIGLHTAYIKDLEARGLLNRALECLPTDKELLERKAAGVGLSRPELAVLLAYTKIYLKQEILKSSLPDDPFLSQIVDTAFPLMIRTAYAQPIQNHPLKRHIIATQLSNRVVNRMGITFIYRMQVENAASVEEIIRAYTVAACSFDMESFQQLVDSLAFKIPMIDQFDILHNARKLISLSTRWFLRHEHYREPLDKLIASYKAGINRIEPLITHLMTGSTRAYLESLTEKFLNADLPPETAQHIATYRAIYTALNIIEVASKYSIDLEKTAKVYFSSGERLNLVWLRDHIATDTREDYWHALTRLILRDELDSLQQELSISILQEKVDEEDTIAYINAWLARHPLLRERWDKFLALLHASPSIEYSMFFIAIRELSNLIRKEKSIR